MKDQETYKKLEWSVLSTFLLRVQIIWPKLEKQQYSSPPILHTIVGEWGKGDGGARRWTKECQPESMEGIFSNRGVREQRSSSRKPHPRLRRKKIRRGDEEQIGRRSRADLELQESKMARYFRVLPQPLTGPFYSLTSCHPW